MTISLRAFAESKSYCGLTLSPLMGGIMDASAGIGLGLEPALSLRYFGCDELPEKTHRTIVIRAGARGGKTSRLVAVAALHAVWTVPLPTLARGEFASFIVVAPDLKLARQALTFVSGYVENSPSLRAARIEETRDSITLRRPDGRLVRIEILAATRGGRAVRGRTLVGAAMDESCFFYTDDNVICDAEVYRALLPRIVPGGQLWLVSTPWIEGVGLLEDLFAKNFGAHVHALCVSAPTRALNTAWDPDGSVERALREQDPDAAAREIDAIPMSGGTGTFLDSQAITAGIDNDRPLALPRISGVTYLAASDWGFKRDSSALAIVRVRGAGIELASLTELRPAKGAPLRPDHVVDAFAVTLKEYGCTSVLSDAWYIDEIAPRLQTHGITLRTSAGATKSDTYIRFRTLLHEGRIRYPNVPRLVAQLRSVVSKPGQAGALTISSPRTQGGGHGDLLSALVLAAWQAAPARVPVSLAQFNKYKGTFPRCYIDGPRRGHDDDDDWTGANDVRTRR